MHEISLLENMLEILQQQAQAQGFKRIKKITLEIGQLSCVEPDALRFGFDVVMKNSLAEQAQLEIIPIPGKGWCEHCQQSVALETLYDGCSFCGRPEIKITQGREMKIKDLLVIQ